jgi:hypothetical protein
LTTATVLFGKHHLYSLQDFFAVALQGGVEHTITVDDDEAKLVVIC